MRLRFGHPNRAGIFEKDDGENWQQSTAATTGVIQARYPFNYQLAFGKEAIVKEPGLPYRLVGLTNDYVITHSGR